MGVLIRLAILPREDVSGPFSDKIRIVADTESGTVNYHLTVFGILAADDLPANATGSSR